jgi:X-Pro dipeptidyl-peptidase C-terminal non-catalytic domain
MLAAATLALTLLSASGARAAAGPAVSFSAHGSVEQVYATGLGPLARASLLNRAGRSIATNRADSLGGLLFRNVKPGVGYHVRLSSGGAESGPLTVLSTRPQPSSSDIYNQTIPSSGYGYLTAPLGANTTVVGAGAVHIWLRSSTPNVDLQATVTEVRPDGKETFVQNGWVRGDERKLDPRKSTLLEPVLSLRRADVSRLPRHRFVKVTIPLYYEGHAYRAGSRIRVTIAAPNGDQPIWSFSQASPAGHAQVAIADSTRMPSSLILPVVPGVSVPTGLPPCPGLRNEPCRAYQAVVNRTTSP